MKANKLRHRNLRRGRASKSTYFGAEDIRIVQLAILISLLSILLHEDNAGSLLFTSPRAKRTSRLVRPHLLLRQNICPASSPVLVLDWCPHSYPISTRLLPPLFSLFIHLLLYPSSNPLKSILSYCLIIITIIRKSKVSLLYI